MKLKQLKLKQLFSCLLLLLLVLGVSPSYSEVTPQMEEKNSSNSLLTPLQKQEQLYEKICLTYEQTIVSLSKRIRNLENYSINRKKLSVLTRSLNKEDEHLLQQLKKSKVDLNLKLTESRKTLSDVQLQLKTTEDNLKISEENEGKIEKVAKDAIEDVAKEKKKTSFWQYLSAIGSVIFFLLGGYLGISISF